MSPLHYHTTSSSEFGLAFDEIFVKRLPDSPRRGVDKIACSPYIYVYHVRCVQYSVHLVWKIYYIYWCCKHKIFYKEKCGEQLAAPRLFGYTWPVQCSISWSGAETETKNFKMVAKFKYKRTSITTMRINSLVPFHNLIHSHWSVLLINSYLESFFFLGGIQKSVKFPLSNYMFIV
jgi:hypothetical protein